MKLSRSAALTAALSIVAAVGVPAGAEPIPGVPGLDVAVTRVSEKTPVFIVSQERHQSSQGAAGSNFIQCIDFRVLSRKAVSAVRFTIRFRDTFNNEHFIDVSNNAPWNLDRKGFFSSGQVVRANYDPNKTYINNGAESCWVVPATFSDTGRNGVSKMSIETTQVAFNDGSVWRVGQSFDQAFAPNGSASRVPLNVTQRWVSEGHAPVELTASGTGYDFGGDPQQCVSFRDVANQVASSVDFDVVYVDRSGNRLVERTVSHVGTFTPPVSIEDKCRNVNLGSADTMRAISRAEVHVRRVVFNDGTEWTEGQPFTRVYGNNGDRLPQPLFVAASSSPVPLDGFGTPPPVQVFGPNGTPLAPGQRFGAIAVDRTATFAAVAADRDSPGNAAADAVDKCNTQSGGNTCAVKLTFSATDRCGAIAIRVLQGTPVGFVSIGATQREAESNALTKAGTTDTSILASGCNSP